MTRLLPDASREALSKRLTSLYAAYFAQLARGPEHIAQMVRDSLDESRACAQLESFVRATGVPLAGKKVLEIGAGVGLTVALAHRKFGADCRGVEPGTAEYEGTLSVARDLLSAFGIDPAVVHEGVGESLPFPDASFDIVLSSNVLEHVRDPRKVIAETLRVLRPGGYFQFIIPNYGSWWEGHYGILWLPHMPAWMAKRYVGLLGRDPSYIDTLQLISHGRLARWLRAHGDRIEILGWGEDVWEERLRTLGFTEYAALGRLKSMLKVLHRLGVVPLLIRLGRALHWETPLIVTVRKRGPDGA